MDKPIPAFYACYLLRSTVRHASLYVGSTPNPVRRLRQHNGDAKGGAARTSRDSLRPWEMTCLVTGFPSKIAALQFEWAWQNPHLTRHVAPDSRLTQARMTVRYSPKTGRTRKRSARPRISLTDRLSHLDLLLRSSSFDRWPLKVVFYCQDVFRIWKICASMSSGSIRQDVAMDESSRAATERVEPDLLVKGIHSIDVGYGPVKSHVEKGQRLSSEQHACSICRKTAMEKASLLLVCPHETCHSVAHLQCLAATFLTEEEGTTALVPTTGNCPGCGTQLGWIDLVKELSLRTRGSKEVEALFKVRRSRKKKDTPAELIAANDDHGEMDSDQADDPLPDDAEWHHLSGSEELDEVDLNEPQQSSLKSRAGLSASKFLSANRVIEDSDWDEVEIVT